MKQWERTGAKDLANKLEREENMTSYQDKIRKICVHEDGGLYTNPLSEDQFQAIFKEIEEYGSEKWTAGYNRAIQDTKDIEMDKLRNSALNR